MNTIVLLWVRVRLVDRESENGDKMIQCEYCYSKTHIVYMYAYVYITILAIFMLLKRFHPEVLEL